jgi:cytosine/adenosine deaminase-related metal-dependent hydrolase
MERQTETTTAADVFNAATLGGARALGRDDLGRLAPGAKADITVVDLGELRSGPSDDPIRTMLYNTSGGQVRTVIINGRTVMADRRIPGVDEAAMRERAQRYFAAYKQAYTARDYLHRAPEDLFPPSFAVIAPPG